MGYGNPKLVYAKKKGFSKRAYCAKMYNGRPNEETKRRFYAAPYGMQKKSNDSE